MQRESSYIIVMDGDNLAELEGRFGRHSRLYRLLDFASKTAEQDVPDPYYTGQFDYVYQLVKDGCAGLLKKIREQEGI